MTELPDWIKEKVEIKAGRELQEPAVAKVFVECERPYLTRRQVEARLDGDYSKGTVIARLNGLCEIGVLNADERMKGSIYWLHNKKSNWPIPPDVDVESKSDEMTVTEFFNQTPVEYGALGIGIILIASVVIWIGTILIAENITLFGISNSLVLAIGIASIIAGWILILVSLFMWLRRPPFSEK